MCSWRPSRLETFTGLSMSTKMPMPWMLQTSNRVGPTEEQCIERAEKEGWTLGKSQGSFRANSKALAEGEANGMAKVLFNKDTGKVVAVHIIGIHAADLIQECSNAVAAGTTVKELSMMVHTHPTLCEVLDEAFKGAVGMSAH